MISRCSPSIIAFLLCSFSLFAQVEEPVKPAMNGKPEKERMKFSDRLVFGGDIALSVGTVTYINISPAIGYRITDRLVAGLGPIYIYEHFRDFNLESSTFGGKVISSFTVLRSSDISPNLSLGNLILHIENEVINVQPLFSDPFGGQAYFGSRLWIDDFLVGGGLSQSIGSRFNISVLILWDVTHNIYSPYTNPVFRIGFGF